MSNAYYDPASGIITLRSTGFHSPEQVSERSRIVNELVAVAKRDKGYARILNFAEDLPVQSSDVAETSTRSAQKDNTLTDPRDKFAIVITSTLARMQVQRIIGSDNRRAFATEAEARAWLAAD